MNSRLIYHFFNIDRASCYIAASASWMIIGFWTGILAIVPPAIRACGFTSCFHSVKGFQAVSLTLSKSSDLLIAPVFQIFDQFKCGLTMGQWPGIGGAQDGS